MRERIPTARAACASLLAAGFLGLLSTGCYLHHPHGGGHVVTHGHGGHGPPAHAPAHGHRLRHAHDDVDLIFDAVLGVYIVLGHAGLYWHGDHYISWRDGGWYSTARIGGTWVSVGSQDVPTPLVTKHGKGHQRGNASHGGGGGYGGNASHGGDGGHGGNASHGGGGGRGGNASHRGQGQGKKASDDKAQPRGRGYPAKRGH